MKNIASNFSSSFYITFIPISAVFFFTETVFGGLGLGLEGAGLGLGPGLLGLGLGTLVLTTTLAVTMVTLFVKVKRE